MQAQSEVDRVESGGRDSGLTLTRTDAVGGVSVTIDATTPSEVWHMIANDERFQRALVDAVREAATGHTAAEFREALEDAEIETLRGTFATLCVRVAAGDERAAWDLLRETRGLATGRSPLEDALAVARVFTLSERTPTVAVRVSQAFRELRTEQGRDVCRLLAELARGCDVRLVVTGFMQRWLATEHREDLPVSREDITPRDDGPHDEAITAARDVLDPDTREVALLRDLVDEATGTLSYTALASTHQVSRSRIRQVVGRLVDLDLVATFDGAAGRVVEVLPAGRQFIETLDTEIGRQRGLQSALAERRQSSPQSPVSPERTRDPPTEEAGATAAGAGAYFVEYMSRSQGIAAAAAAAEGGVSLVDHPVEGRENPKEPWIDYDRDADRAVVSVQATEPYPTAVRVARALASPPIFDQVLTPDRLDDVLAEVPRDVLLRARQLGWFPDDADDGEAFAEELETAREDLVDLTRAVRNGDVDDRERARSTVMREARGLAGTIAHLLDLAGVETVVEYRLPEFARHYDPEDRAELAETIVGLLTVTSRYGHYSGHRLLYEDRDRKRRQAGSPDVDATDPFGDLLLDTVIVADGVESFRPYLVDELEALAPHEDAPEVALPVDVMTPGRDAYEQAVTEVLATKNMDLRPEVVDVLRGYAGSVYDVTTALTQALAGEDLRRKVRLSEARRALAMLPSDRLLPDAAPTVRAIVAALLRAEEPLTQADLAEAADVSTRSVQRHGERLAAFDLVRIDAEGYRVTLPFNTDAERYDRGPLPWYATPTAERENRIPSSTEEGALVRATEILDVEGTDAVIDATAIVMGKSLPPPVREDVAEAWSWAPPILDAVRAIAADEPRVSDAETVLLGPEIEQAALEDATTGDDATATPGVAP